MSDNSEKMGSFAPVNWMAEIRSRCFGNYDNGRDWCNGENKLVEMMMMVEMIIMVMMVVVVMMTLAMMMALVEISV